MWTTTHNTNGQLLPATAKNFRQRNLTRCVATTRDRPHARLLAYIFRGGVELLVMWMVGFWAVVMVRSRADAPIPPPVTAEEIRTSRRPTGDGRRLRHSTPTVDALTLPVLRLDDTYIWNDPFRRGLREHLAVEGSARHG